MLSLEACTMRMIDLRTTIDVLEEAVERPIGARRRVAERLGIQPSVVTDRIHRVETEIGGDPLEADGRLTVIGVVVLEHGHRILGEFDAMMNAVKDAAG